MLAPCDDLTEDDILGALQPDLASLLLGDICGAKKETMF
jgi:hypothetical protein